MAQTEQITGGSECVSRSKPRYNIRLAGFISLLVLGTLLVIWINGSIGTKMGRLKSDFAAIQSERYFVAVQARASVRALNNALFNFRLSRDLADRDAFQTQARELREWLGAQGSNLTTPGEKELFGQLEPALTQYIAALDLLLAVSDQEAEQKLFREVFAQVQQESRRPLDLCAELLQAQRRALDSFLQDSQQTMTWLQRLFKLFIGMLFTLAVSLALLVYRGMITPLRQEISASQAIILRQEKLASLGTLAAGVAHEIRNPLTAIKLRLFSLNKSLPPEFSGNQDATVISEEINRLERIVKDFLQFARPSDPEVVRVPAERILKEVGDLLRAQLEKSGIQFRLEAPGTTWIHADIQQLKQVLINLIQNAAQSIGHNGSVSLRVKRSTAEFAGRSRPAVVLQVIDTGKGIPPDVQKRLFDPFFSTKEGSSGLGLAIAARIVEKHGGLLRFETELKHGTTFEVVLPCIEDHAT